MALADMATANTADPLSLTEIAARQNLSVMYLEQLFLKLRNSRLVEAIRGAGGGYRLTRSPSRITIFEIMEAVQEPLKTIRCTSDSVGCIEGSRCQTHDLWEGLGHTIGNYLASVTLEDVCQKKVKKQMFFLPAHDSTEVFQKKTVYLDYNATAPLRPEAFTSMMEVSQKLGNGSSVHYFGREMRKYIEDARSVIAQALHVLPAQVVFTSGGTEANQSALRSLLNSYPRSPLFLSAIEHDSVRLTGIEEKEIQDRIRWIPVTPEGMVDLEAFKGFLENSSEPPLVSVMYANNETGVIQPLSVLSRWVHEKGGVIHCDAVQALGKMPLSFPELDLDMMSLSSHKIGGPKGVGALILKEGIPFQPLLKGGGQERNRRPGTENGPAIVGFAAALKAALSDNLLEWAQIVHGVEDSDWERFQKDDHQNFIAISQSMGGTVPLSVLIWTTTPWTIPQNRAVAFNPAIDYGLYELTFKAADGSTSLEKVIVADKLAEGVFAAGKVEPGAVRRVSRFNPVELTLSHPFRGVEGGNGEWDYDVPMLPGDHVTDDAGTGFVHTAPSHGDDDYQLGVKFGLPMTYNVEADGSYRADLPLFGGQHIITPDGKEGPANVSVIKQLAYSCALFAKAKLKHSYPHSWRSKAPVIYRNTPQWFVAIDKVLDDGMSTYGQTIRTRALNSINQLVEWTPSTGRNRPAFDDRGAAGLGAFAPARLGCAADLLRQERGAADRCGLPAAQRRGERADQGGVRGRGCRCLVCARI